MTQCPGEQSRFLRLDLDRGVGWLGFQEVHVGCLASKLQSTPNPQRHFVCALLPNLRRVGNIRAGEPHVFIVLPNEMSAVAKDKKAS